MKKSSLGKFAAITILALFPASLILVLLGSWQRSWVALIMFVCSALLLMFCVAVLIGQAERLPDGYLRPITLIQHGKSQKNRWVWAAGWAAMVCPIPFLVACFWDQLRLTQ